MDMDLGNNAVRAAARCRRRGSGLGVRRGLHVLRLAGVRLAQERGGLGGRVLEDPPRVDAAAVRPTLPKQPLQLLADLTLLVDGSAVLSMLSKLQQ